MAFVVFAGAWHGMLFAIKEGKIKGWENNTFSSSSIKKDGKIIN